MNADPDRDPGLAASSPDASAVIEGQRYSWQVDDAGVVVRNADGHLLDPVAASVILALGGRAPAWLSVVESLESAAAAAPERGGEALAAAAQALALEAPHQAEIAGTTSDRAVLAALAARGRVEAAANPRCDRRAWDLLLDHRDPEVRARVLAVTETLPPALHDHPDPETRVRVARNPACPAHVLAALANGEASVRKVVGQNPHADARTLRALAEDADVWVRRSAAGNPACPLPSLRRLLTDRYAEVRVAAVGNAALTRREAEKRMLFDPTPAVHVALAQRSDLRPWALSLLERYARRDPVAQYGLVCARLAAHPATTPALAQRLRAVGGRLDALSPGDAARIDNARTAPRPLEPLRGLAACGAGLLMLVAATAVGIGAGESAHGHAGTGGEVIGAALLVVVAIGFGVRAAARRHAPPLGYAPPLVGSLWLGSLRAVTVLPVLGLVAAVVLSILAIGVHAGGAQWADGAVLALLAARLGWWSWRRFGLERG